MQGYMFIPLYCASFTIRAVTAGGIIHACTRAAGVAALWRKGCRMTISRCYNSPKHAVINILLLPMSS